MGQYAGTLPPELQPVTVGSMLLHAPRPGRRRRPGDFGRRCHEATRAAAPVAGTRAGAGEFGLRRRDFAPREGDSMKAVVQVRNEHARPARRTSPTSTLPRASPRRRLRSALTSLAWPCWCCSRWRPAAPWRRVSRYLWTLLNVLFGTALVVAGASTLNQVIERRTDARMPHRESAVAGRPPSAAGSVPLFGASLGGGGVAYLALTLGHWAARGRRRPRPSGCTSASIRLGNPGPP